jgi:transposase-like protein
MLMTAIDDEVADWIESHAELRDSNGRRQVVRNGHLPSREILTGLGPVEVRQPRVLDRRPPESQERFSSKILPPYLRKTKSIEELVPWLYAKGLSAPTVTRLKSIWEQEYAAWSRRSLEGKRYAYVWADGVHFNIRLEEGRQCILVLMGATSDGKKELIAVADGVRESEQSWTSLLLDVKSRGLTIDPKLAIADRALGFWKALGPVYESTREQLCWVHKTANILDKLPKCLQGQAKDMIHQIWMAPTKKKATMAFDRFLETFEAKYPKATNCLRKDRDALLTFYDFPAEHWVHIRTTNPIESTFATVRLRTRRTKGSGSRIACLTMVFKLMESASKKWRALNGYHIVADVIADITFVDGEKTSRKAA